MNIEIQAAGITRVDLKINGSGFAACVLSEKDFLFMRMNGNHAVPRLMDIINAPVDLEAVTQFMVAHPLVYEGIGRRFFQKWAADTAWGLE